ncbi:helix-turn-helix transcriptional regulator [uncultured Treponema sp.]|jgi:transcriptional regulator with XRE-family HTH domain|uniref:helix-turn-helix domain-containing protein n=1 Tax=uncultured Treponema sp. TaxID=162155 RepID=UPI0025D0C56B|nr:helix-turn-helix transcriptional regulator [uncultured Treponema sp.]
MNFKERLREEIEYKGLQLKEVSALAGVNNNTFLSYVDARGSLPNVEIGVKIAKALGVSVEYLVTGEDSELSRDSKHSDIQEILNDLQSLDKEKISFLKKMIHSIV